MDNPEAIKIVEKKKTALRKKKIRASGNSADAVLLYEYERMFNYIDDDILDKINSKSDALRYGVKAIGTKNDPPAILKKYLIPETSDQAREFFAEELLKKVSFERNINKDFYSKNRYKVEIKYLRNGKEIKYFAVFDVRTGKRHKTPKKFKKKNVKRK